MATKSNRLVPVRAIHPGEILREELQERGIKQKDFAEQIGMQATHLSEFIRGKRNLNDDLAMKLENHLGIPYKTWMNLHNGYMYDSKAVSMKQSEEQEARAFEDACARVFNLKLLYKKLNLAVLPLLDRVKATKSLFPFDLLSSAEMSKQVAGLYKHSDKVQIDEKNMQTWLLLSWLATSREKVERTYVHGNGIKAADTIAKLANERRLTAMAIKDCLHQNGIGYVVVEKLDKAPVDAFSTYVNQHPIVTVTYRYNDIDKLAFDVLHELCHIEKHFSEEHRSFISIEGTIYSKDPREKEANDFAKEHLIPCDVWNKILSGKSSSLSPHVVVKTIAKEAEKYGISPTIAVSRYKHDTNWYRTSAYKSSKIY